MRKKESWMFKGAIILALGEKGVISKMEENNIDGINYVYYIHVRLEHKRQSAPYHPADIAELKVNAH